MSQKSSNDCAVACLLMILKIFDIKNISYQRIKNQINIDNEGASAFEIIKVAKKYGLNAVGFKNYVITENSNFPLIAHLLINNVQHFVVVLKANKKTITILDPAKDVMEITYEDFNEKYTGIVISFNDNKSIFKTVFKSKKIFIHTVLLSLILSFFNIVFSYTFSLSLTFVSNHKVNILILLFIIGLLRELFSYLKDVILLKFQLLIDKAITIPTLKKIINLPHEFYSTNDSGALISKVNDLSHVKKMILSFVSVFIVNFIVLISIYILVLVIDYKLFLLNIFTSILLFYFSNKFHRRYFSKTYELQLKNENLNSNISNALTGIISIKNLAKENFFNNRLESKYNSIINDYGFMAKKYCLKNLLFKMLFLLINVYIIFYISFFKTGVNAIFIIYIESIIFESLNEIINLQPMYTNFKSSYVRINELFKNKEITFSKNTINIKKIMFKNLTYKIDNNTILKNVSFSIENGSKVMIVGNSGCGKTTLFKILTKQLKVSNDMVFLNGIEINDYEYDEVRKSMVYVDQKTRLFKESLLKNITLGDDFKLGKNYKSLIKSILDKNNISYDYQIDSTNTTLSGGESQIIMIAQALNTNPSVLILDETTSQMDILTEKKVISAIKKDYPKLTLILISHRCSNKESFDKIISFCKKSVRRQNEKIKQSRTKKYKGRRNKRLGSGRYSSRNNIFSRSN